MAHNVLTRCLACDNLGLQPVLNLGVQPLANAYLAKPLEKMDAFGLEVMHCLKCTHSQLSMAIDRDMLYKDYKYVSGTTQTLKDHFAKLAREVNELSDPYHPWRGQRPDLPPYDPSQLDVLDIGCNDGTLLEAFRACGNNITGCDPAENLRSITAEKGIPVLVDYWDADAGFKIDGHYGCITALNCLAHNADPRSFLRGCKRVLRPGGMILVEFPYFKETVERTDFGQFYAEHHSYFTARSFTILCESLGLRVAGAVLFPEIHGGTVRFLVQANEGPHAEGVRELIRKEAGITHKIAEMQHKINLTTDGLTSAIMQLCGAGDRTFVAYGASAKSSTLFNLPDMKASAALLDYVVDDNPLKQGMYCPGSNLPIHSPDKLKEEKPEDLVILLTVHNFKKEVCKRLMDMGLGDVTLINYTPELKVEKVSDNAH